MKREEALELLKEYIEEYDCFVFHGKFLAELGNIITGIARGSEKTVFSQIVKQFTYVKDYGTKVNDFDHNEILKNVNGDDIYYSLHVKTKAVNLRMLMTFDLSIPIFLVAFNEKSGKKITSYSKQIDVMIKRYEEVKEARNNE